jgi:hypothetical protein
MRYLTTDLRLREAMWGSNMLQSAGRGRREKRKEMLIVEYVFYNVGLGTSTKNSTTSQETLQQALSSPCSLLHERNSASPPLCIVL